MEILAKIMGWLGVGKLSFVTVDKDTLATYVGLAGAVIAALSNYLVTGGDPQNPMFWVLAAITVKEAYQGYITNKK
jgi:hypothetical protein